MCVKRSERRQSCCVPVHSSRVAAARAARQSVGGSGDRPPCTPWRLWCLLTQAGLPDSIAYPCQLPRRDCEILLLVFRPFSALRALHHARDGPPALAAVAGAVLHAQERAPVRGPASYLARLTQAPPPARSDFSNGFLVAEIFSRYYSAGEVAMHSFDPAATAVERKRDNWMLLEKLAKARQPASAVHLAPRAPRCLARTLRIEPAV